VVLSDLYNEQRSNNRHFGVTNSKRRKSARTRYHANAQKNRTAIISVNSSGQRSLGHKY